MSPPLEKKNLGSDCRCERLGSVSSDVACYNSVDFCAAGRRELSVVEKDRSGSSSSSSISSIGNNSDESSGAGRDGEEVQSEYKGGPLANLDSLEAVLPIKKSLSKFYCGKSISFTSLSDAASNSSIQDIAKPEDAYTRKRKNIMAYNNSWGKASRSILRSGNKGMSKRPNNSTNMSSLVENASYQERSCGDTSNSNSSLFDCCISPLPPHGKGALYKEFSPSPPLDKFCSWRSYSLSDLRGAATVNEGANLSIPGLRIKNNG